MTITADKAKQSDLLRPATPEEYFELLEQDEYVVGALMRIYAFQTDDEQAAGYTKYWNDMGFNGLDATTLSDIAEFYKRTNFLTPKQAELVKKMIKKYHRQIIQEGFAPMPIKARKQTTERTKAPNNVNLSAGFTNDFSKIKIKFWYPKGDQRFSEVLKKVKTLIGRRFVKKERCWYAALSTDSTTKLLEWGFKFEKALQDWHDRLTIQPDLDLDIDIPGLGGILRPFQKEGVAFLESRNGRGIIGDEMGLGKTVQALAYLQLHPELRPAIVVVPANVKIHWVRETIKWLSMPDVYMLTGRADPDQDKTQIHHHQVAQGTRGSKGAVIIINYDILANMTEKIQDGIDEFTRKPIMKKVEIPGTGWADYLEQIKPKIMIPDECHYLKNNKAARTKAFKRIAEKCEIVIGTISEKNNAFGLSGTPIVNRPIEFFTILSIVRPSLFPSWKDFGIRYCAGTHNGYGWDMTGASNKDELHKILTETVMIRRLKKDVAKDLPDKIPAVIPVEIDNRAEYDRAETDLMGWIEENIGPDGVMSANNAEQLVRFNYLKQIAAEGKMTACIQWIEDFISSGEKLLVFAHHKKIISQIMKKFGKIAVKIDGSVPAKKRQDIVDQFNDNDHLKLFVGSEAAREGISLRGSSNIAFLELYWNPGWHDQAGDRIHGINRGIEGVDSMTLWYLVADQTIELEKVDILDKKRKNIAAILDGEKVEDYSVLSHLLDLYKNRLEG